MSLKSDNHYVIGQRYAKAFCNAGVSTSEMNEFLEIGNLLANDALFMPSLNIAKGKTSKDKKTSLDWVRDFANKLKLSQKVTNFLCLIAFKNRLFFLSAIITAVQDIVNIKQGCDFVTLKSAKPLTDSDIVAIKQEIKAMINFEPILKIETDTKLLDGYVVRTRSVLIDNSLKSRIEKLHNTMKGVA